MCLRSNLAEHERVLADAIVDVATELRLADPTEFIMLVRGEQAANIADLVNSSSELFFKKGALRYALVGGLRARLGIDAERAAWTWSSATIASRRSSG